jgi:hypothetical protein
MTQLEYHIKFPKARCLFNELKATFSIGKAKCRTVAIIYPIIHCFNPSGTLINSIIGTRGVVDETWSPYHYTFELTEKQRNDIAEIQIELVMLNVSNDNSLKFTECMLKDGEYTAEEYFAPDDDVSEVTVEFPRNTYVNLYSNNQEGDYLQIIRPDRTRITNQKLLKADTTVLVPHLAGETELDKPINIYMEYINQTEQTTNIKTV